MVLNPPSMTNSEPVIKLPALLDASRSVAPMSSSGSPKRDIGVFLKISRIRDSSSAFLFSSEGKNPGMRVLTRMSFSAHSREKFLVRLCKAALDAE